MLCIWTLAIQEVEVETGLRPGGQDWKGQMQGDTTSQRKGSGEQQHTDLTQSCCENGEREYPARGLADSEGSGSVSSQ